MSLFLVIMTNFQVEKIPKENASYKCLLLIMLDSGARVNKKHYPETLLEEWKYEIKSNKMHNQINDDFDSSSCEIESDNESDKESDNGSDNESNTDESND